MVYVELGQVSQITARAAFVEVQLAVRRYTIKRRIAERRCRSAIQALHRRGSCVQDAKMVFPAQQPDCNAAAS